MTRHQTKLMREWFDRHREVLMAYENGAEIEYFNSDMGDWKSFGGPGWNFPGRTGAKVVDAYRVKPSPKLRPHNREQLNELVGKVIVRKSDGLRFLGSHVSTHSDVFLVFTNGTYSTPSSILEDFKHLDGSPCGVLEKESES